MKDNLNRCRVEINPTLVNKVNAKMKYLGVDIYFFTAYMNTTDSWAARFLKGNMKRTSKEFFARLNLFIEAEDLKALTEMKHLFVAADVAKIKVEAKPKPNIQTMPTNFKPYTQQIKPRIWAEQSNLVSKYLGRKNTN